MNFPSDSDSKSRPISVRLDDFLKLHGLVGTGGEAKVRIQAGEVKVNDRVETRRRRQLSEGDRIEFDGNHYLVELNDL